MQKTTELSEAKRALLAKYIRGEVKQATKSVEPIPRRVHRDTAPLSFGQQQMWLLAQLMPDSAVYTENVTIHLPGPLNVAVLERSFNEIIRRHEAWRTSFPIVDGQPVQKVHPTMNITLPTVDLRSLPQGEREREALRIASENVQQPFDLANGPLLHPLLVHLGDEDHRLFLTLHHIIFDGMSVYQIFLPELGTLYEAFLAGKASPLPELPIQYADFAVWQQQWLQSSGYTEELAYWKKQLEHTPAALELPTDRGRPLISTYAGAIYPFTLSKQLTDALRAMSSREGYTLYMTLMAAFTTLLYRYTGQEDIAVGTAAEGRNHPSVRHLMGMFINTLTMRTNLAGNPSFRELLKRVREVTLDAHAHQTIPFEHLVKELQPKRERGQNPFFQTMFMLEPPTSTLASGWRLTHTEIDTQTAKFDLSLLLEDQAEGLVGYFEYSTDLFNATTIERMAGHLQTLLEGIVAHPEQRIAELPLLTTAERQQMLVEWNKTENSYPQDKGFHQLFEEQVERTPDAVALVFEHERLTYRELNRKANQLAHYLQQQGVGPGMLVGLCVERSLEMVVGLLGILKAGGAYVPMDPTYPVERLAFMLEDTQAPVLVTQQSLTAGQSEHKALVICMDADWNAIARMSEENVVSQVTADNLVYVIYTSGSTGRPKGVAVEHRQLLNYLNGILQRLELPTGSSFATVSTLATDLGNTAIFPSLCTGGCLHVLSRERTTDAHALVDYFQSHPIDCLKITPSHLAALQALSQTKPIMPLRRLIIGGESSSWEWVNKLQALAPDCTIFNHYGPTETTVGVLTYRVKREQEQDKRSYTLTPLGRPIANTQIYLLDQYRCPVPIGVPGEVYIGGASVARGYLNRPELTAEKFIPDPFSAKSGSRLYKTGDLARYLSDGNIEFLGRIDDQIKLRGFRIELGEIEEVLRQHPDVRSAAVVVREETPDNKYLVAYVVVDQQQSSTLSSIQNSLKEKLPTYMIPSSFVMLDALPLTPSGKIDRRALPAPDTSSRIVEEVLVAPTLTAHYQLIKIWEELLDARPIGIKDNFFLLGGHSLLAIRLVARIQEVFGKKISLATLFAGPTIEQLTKTLQQHEETVPPPPITAVQAGGTRRPFFFLHGAHKAGAFYCFPLAHEVGTDQPFYAVEPYKFQDVTALPTLEAIAAAHIEQMRSIQPEGPYLLGGFCNGGLFAYEMARQLHAQGQALDLLALMEPTPVGYRKPSRRAINFIGNLLHLDQDTQIYWFLWPQHIYKYLLHLYRYVCYPHYRPLEAELQPEQIHRESTIIAALKALYEQKVSLGIERLRAKEGMESERKHDKAKFTLPKLHSIFPDALFPPAKALRRDWAGIFHWIASVYDPGSYPGKSTFFFFEDSKEWYPYREPWRQLATMKDKEVETHILPGTHDNSKTIHLSTLASCLRECLDKAQPTQSS